MLIFNFFFNINNTKYPANNYNSLFFLGFSLTNSYKTKFLISINSYLKKNFNIIPSLNLNL